MTAENLTTEEVAMSAFRAFCFAGQVEEVQSEAWDHQNDDVQERWLRVAHHAREGLEVNFAGKSCQLAAAWLYALWAKDPTAKERFAGLPVRLRCAWEAVVRHLATLLDSEDLDDLGTLERSWGDWAKERNS